MTDKSIDLLNQIILVKSIFNERISLTTNIKLSI